MNAEQFDLLDSQTAARFVEDQILGVDSHDEPDVVTVTVRIDAPVRAYADRLAGELGTSRNKLLRKCITLGLEDVQEALDDFRDHTQGGK